MGEPAVGGRAAHAESPCRRGHGDRPTCREMLEVHVNALKAMTGRAGKMARVVRGGTVRPGDPIEVIGGADVISDGVSGQHAT